MPELKRCPFCGARGKIVGGCYVWVVHCAHESRCNIYGPSRQSERGAIAAWNKRWEEKACE